MKKILFLLSLLAFTLPAQNGHVQQFFYAGSNLQYVCDAPANVDSTSVSKADATFTSIVVSSNVGTVTTAAAHNLWVGARVTVTGSAAAALNTAYAVVSVASSTTYTITTSGVSDGTYATGITITTHSPLLSSPVWSVSVLVYSGAVLTGSYPGGGPLSLNYRAKCTDRATY